MLFAARSRFYLLHICTDVCVLWCSVLQFPLGRFLSHVIQFSTAKLSPSEMLTVVKWICAQASDPSVVEAELNDTVKFNLRRARLFLRGNILRLVRTGLPVRYAGAAVCSSGFRQSRHCTVSC